MKICFWRYMNKRMLSHKGFTLIEIIIATAILVMVGVAAIVVEKQFIGSASTNKHKLQATALAQEGINAVRAKFNTNLLCIVPPCLNPLDINGTGALTAGATYYLDSNNKLQECNNAECSYGVIPQNNITFTRKITFLLTSQMVTVTVTWPEGTRPETVELKTILRDVSH